MGNLRSGTVGNLVGNLQSDQQVNNNYVRVAPKHTTSTPRFLATAITVLRLPKSTPTTDILICCFYFVK